MNDTDRDYKIRKLEARVQDLETQLKAMHTIIVTALAMVENTPTHSTGREAAQVALAALREIDDN